MPTRLSDIGEVTELVSNNNWILDINDEDTRVHLGELVGRILDVHEEHLNPFIDKIRKREQVFETSDSN